MVCFIVEFDNITSVVCSITAYSLCDRLSVVGGDVDDLVALLSQDLQHAVVPEEVTCRTHRKAVKKVRFSVLVKQLFEAPHRLD